MTLSDIIPGVSEAKAIAIAIAGGTIVLAIAGLAIALTVTRHTLTDRTTQRDSLASWQATVRQTTSAAAHIEKNGKPALLALDQVQPQIVYLGQAVTDLNAKVAEQNKAIDDMAASSAAKVKAGSDALAKVEQAREAAQNAATALRASASSNTAKNGACVPSAAFLANSGAL